MTTMRWVGAATTVAQVHTITVGGTIEVGDIFHIDMIGWDGVIERITFVATDTTIANVIAGLEAAWNASTSTAVTPITAVDASPDLVLTADTAGVAFQTAVTSTTETGGGAADDQTISQPVVTTKNEGPLDWSSVDNWTSDGDIAIAIPVDGDDVFVEGDFNVLYGFDQVLVQLDSLNISGARIGTNPIAGYQPVYLNIQSDVLKIGYKYRPTAFTHLVPVQLDMDDDPCVMEVYNSGSNSGEPAVRLTCNNAATTLVVYKGSVGVANEEGETALLASIICRFITNKVTDSDLFIGKNVTLDDLTLDGGEVVCRAETVAGDGKMIDGTLIVNAGELRTEGLGTMDAMIVNGGTAIINSTGTITSLILNGGRTDMTQKAGTPTLTVSAIQVNADATLLHNPVHTIFTVWTEPDSEVILRASKT